MRSPSMPCRCEQGTMTKPTGACTAGVKVRITRQRMVGTIARHSGADIAAGVTTGRLWHSTPHAMESSDFFRGGPELSGQALDTCMQRFAAVRRLRANRRQSVSFFPRLRLFGLRVTSALRRCPRTRIRGRHIGHVVAAARIDRKPVRIRADDFRWPVQRAHCVHIVSLNSRSTGSTS